MNLVPSLMSWQIAVTGILAASVPILLHLLNRRRPQTVHWAAMQFVREALRRQRRIMQLRNVVLLALRVLAVLLLGLALARPYFAAPQHRAAGRAPLHAVLVIDNSLSMSYQATDGTLLQRARRRALEYLEKLPAGSRISVIPACGTAQTEDAARDLDPLQARRRLQAIRTVDGSLDLFHAVSEAKRACHIAPHLDKRVVLFTDRQLVDWRNTAAVEALGALPSLQLVDVSERVWRNTSVAAMRLQGGLADTQTPATIVVELGHYGAREDRDVQLTLSVSGRPVATQTVHLEPGNPVHHVTFQHLFDFDPTASGEAALVPVTATVTPDALPADDRRELVVPVAQSMPVVFVDQYGTEGEDRLAGRLGETRHLRALLAPKPAEGQPGKPLVDVRHVTIDQLHADMLSDARLVVIAGVRDPQSAVPLLRRYLAQGGRLLIAAGGEFDPASWNRAAWHDGRGILPAPLAEAPVSAGETRGESNGSFFLLDADSLRGHGVFQLAGISPSRMRDLYLEPVFFRAVQIDVPSAAAASTGSAADATFSEFGNREARTAVDSGMPSVLGRFAVASRAPLMVERRMGKGHVLFLATGLSSEWSTLPFTNAFVLLDALVRREIGATLPRLEFPPSGRIEVTLPDQQRGPIVQLQRPRSDDIEYLDAGFLGPTRRGVVIEQALERGIYRVRSESQLAGDAAAPPWETLLNVAGRPEESNLTAIPGEQLAGHMDALGLQWIRAGEPISLAGSRVHGQQLWRWLLAAVLLVLLLEMLVVARLDSASKAGLRTARLRAPAGNHLATSVSENAGRWWKRPRRASSRSAAEATLP